MERKILLPPDAYHLWVLMPDIILNYDKVLMDKSDYEECQAKKGRSTYDFLVAQAIKQYFEEGFVKLIDLKRLIDSSRLKIINQFAKDIVSKKSQNSIRFGREMFQHWIEFCDSKIMFYSIDETGFRNVGSDRAKAVWILNSIKEKGLPPEESDFYHIVQLNITKALLSMHVSKQMEIPFHDLTTLKPAIQLITYHFSNQSQYKLPKFEEGEELCDRPLTSLYKMASTGVSYDSPSSIRQIIVHRQDFVTYRNALKEIDSLYSEIKKIAINDDVTHRKLELELLKVRELVNKELNNIRKKHKILWLAIDLLSSFYVPFLSNLVRLLESKDEEKHLDLEIDSKYPQYIWFYAFQKLIRKDPKLITLEKCRGEIKHSSWCSGHLPWYFNHERK